MQPYWQVIQKFFEGKVLKLFCMDGEGGMTPKPPSPLNTPLLTGLKSIEFKEIGH